MKVPSESPAEEAYTAATASVSSDPSTNCRVIGEPRSRAEAVAVFSATAIPSRPTAVSDPSTISMSITSASAAGSAVLKTASSPSMRAAPSPTPTAVSTSSRSDSAAASWGVSPLPLKPPAVTTRSLSTLPVTASSMVASMEAATTVKMVTTATPTISAEAVPAVRRGLRAAFSRASDPVIPSELERSA